MKNRLWKACGRVLGAVVLIIALAWMTVAQPSCRRASPSSAAVDPVALRAHVDALSVKFHPRDWTHRANLDACAQYVSDYFGEAGAIVEDQPFMVDGQPYRNIIAHFGPDVGPRLVVGAHYDAYGETPGADDNASGVAVLLELAVLLGKMDSPPAVDLVAYTLEEPPFFAGSDMGSAVHARSISADVTEIRGVIVLEMVGFYSDAWGSQHYPALALRCMYPSRGNFVAIVSRWNQGSWIKSVKTAMKGATDLPVYSIRAPAALPGVDFSDHRNYWPYGVPSLIVTDTAFYRNKAYHSTHDLPDRLDYRRMAQVTVALCSAVTSLSQEWWAESTGDAVGGD